MALSSSYELPTKSSHKKREKKEKKHKKRKHQDEKKENAEEDVNEDELARLEEEIK